MRRGAGAQTEGMPSLTATALAGLPEVAQGVDLTSLIIDALQDNGIHLDEPMVVVLSSKIVSKALGLRSTDARDSVIDAQTVRVVAEVRIVNGAATAPARDRMIARCARSHRHTTSGSPLAAPKEARLPRGSCA